jgi:ribosomal protein S18 acetylase RimI-like enzyme
MSFAIRPAREGEAEQVRAISAAAYIPAYAPIIGATPRPALEDYTPRVARGEVWLLDTEAGAIAALVLEPHDDHLLVYSIAVLPAHQGKGHARRLLAFAEQQARSAGHREIRLYTNERMEKNLALFRSCGFVESGRRPHPSRPGITLVDFAKPLSAPETAIASRRPAPETQGR